MHLCMAGAAASSHNQKTQPENEEVDLPVWHTCRNRWEPHQSRYRLALFASTAAVRSSIYELLKAALYSVWQIRHTCHKPEIR